MYLVLGNLVPSSLTSIGCHSLVDFSTILTIPLYTPRTKSALSALFLLRYQYFLIASRGSLINSFCLTLIKAFIKVYKQ